MIEINLFPFCVLYIAYTVWSIQQKNGLRFSQSILQLAHFRILVISDITDSVHLFIK